MTITAEQLRAARAILKMEQRGLAEAAEVPVQTLKRYEGSTGPLTGNYQNISSIVKVLEDRGVVFVAEGEVSKAGAGVRMKAKMRSLNSLAKSEDELIADMIDSDLPRNDFEERYKAKHGRYPDYENDDD